MQEGEPYVCNPDLSDFRDDRGFQAAYNWLFATMALKIPKPEGVLHPAWAWYKNYDGFTKPDRRKSLFRGYDKLDVTLELEVPEEKVLLTDFDDWHYVISNWAIISEEDFLTDEDKVYTQDEKFATWEKIFAVEEKGFIQACIWQILPEYIVKIHKTRGN